MIVSVVLLSGCGAQRSSQSTKRTFSDCLCDFSKQDFRRERNADAWVALEHDSAVEDSKQQEAQLVDIPIPLQAVALTYNGVHSRKNEHTTFLAYKVSAHYEELYAFFVLEMERMGWNMISSLEGAESLLVFIKPTKICTISLRDYHNAHDAYMIIISYGIYDEGASQE